MSKPATTPLLSQTFWDRAEDLAYQRVTTAEWRAMLMVERDRPIIRGHVRQVYAKSLGAGVVELRLRPLAKQQP